MAGWEVEEYGGVGGRRAWRAGGSSGVVGKQEEDADGADEGRPEDDDMNGIQLFETHEGPFVGFGCGGRQVAVEFAEGRAAIAFDEAISAKGVIPVAVVGAHDGIQEEEEGYKVEEHGGVGGWEATLLKPSLPAALANHELSERLLRLRLF